MTLKWNTKKGGRAKGWEYRAVIRHHRYTGLIYLSEVRGLIRSHLETEQNPFELENREIPSSPDQVAVFTAFFIHKEAVCQVKMLISHDCGSIG